MKDDELNQSVNREDFTDEELAKKMADAGVKQHRKSAEITGIDVQMSEEDMKEGFRQGILETLKRDREEGKSRGR